MESSRGLKTAMFGLWLLLGLLGYAFGETQGFAYTAGTTELEYVNALQSSGGNDGVVIEVGVGLALLAMLWGALRIKSYFGRADLVAHGVLIGTQAVYLALIEQGSISETVFLGHNFVLALWLIVYLSLLMGWFLGLRFVWRSRAIGGGVVRTLALWVGLGLAALPSVAEATGLSSAEVRLEPIAARGDAVFFRTRWTTNEEGARTVRPIEFGWLVVTRSGKWEEFAHAKTAPDRERGLPDPKAKALTEEFEAPFPWDAPPRSAGRLLKKYGFTRADAVAPNAGEGTVTWTPERLCQGDHCWPTCQQRSLRGLRSTNEAGAEVQAAFAHSGLVLFRNKAIAFDGPKEEGPAFAPGRATRGWSKDGYDSESVAGICWLPKK